MSSFQQSPGVETVEKDAAAVTTGASSTVGGHVGVFKWGPVMTPMLISNEDEIVNVFGKPDDLTFKSFFAASNFLAYTSACWLVRAQTGNTNAVSSGTSLLIGNVDVYEEAFSAGQAAVGPFAARYPGTMGNSLLISMADAATFPTWDYRGQFQSAPGSSDFALSKNSTNDEVHIIIVDAGGLFSGTPGSVLEKFSFVSKAVDAISFEGLSNYYANVLRNQSSFAYWMDHPTGVTNWGTPAANKVFSPLQDTIATGYDFTYVLTGGTDDNVPSDGELQLGWDLFKNVEMFDVSLFFVGSVTTALAKYVADNVADTRLDAVVFSTAVTPTGGPIYGNSSTKLADAATYKTAMGNSTYVVHDQTFKYMYDKYNDKYRWVALNSDTAGLAAKVDSTHDTWFSPAGYTKGQIKGAIKLSWNPSKPERDELYKLAINSVVSFKGDGTMLFGDKTGTLKPSAFDRINVRRLFLVLEKSISRSAKYQLFEQNDAITRLSFVASVEPFLRDVQGRRGIDEFKVICDESNNTKQVRAANEFRGTVLIRPIYSINFIKLTFTAVGPNVSFEIAAGV